MANKIKVQEQEAIKNFVALGWAIRKIARELGVISVSARWDSGPYLSC
jgi:IS30 family transposase